MKLPLFRRSARPDTISVLYGTIVAQARSPCFYREYAVADTVNGRFDVLSLHLILVLERISREPSLAGLSQGLFDRFWRDMDHNLREMGVGDLSVPKKMRELGEAYYGRTKAYRLGLAGTDSDLAQALARNVYAGGNAQASVRLARYARRVAQDLDTRDAHVLASGALRFPDPALTPTAG